MNHYRIFAIEHGTVNSDVGDYGANFDGSPVRSRCYTAQESVLRSSSDLDDHTPEKLHRLPRRAGNRPSSIVGLMTHANGRFGPVPRAEPDSGKTYGDSGTQSPDCISPGRVNAVSTAQSEISVVSSDNAMTLAPSEVRRGLNR